MLNQFPENGNLSHLLQSVEISEDLNLLEDNEKDSLEYQGVTNSGVPVMAPVNQNAHIANRLGGAAEATVVNWPAAGAAPINEFTKEGYIPEAFRRPS